MGTADIFAEIRPPCDGEIGGTGLPFPGKELTSDYNPLEAGLWHAVHFDKGCYIGQETISRVNAYNAVNTALYGVSFEDSVEEGAELIVQETGKRRVIP